MKEFLSRVIASYGEQVSTDRSPAPGGVNIKGQNNGRQILTAIATGLVVGVTTTLGIFASNPAMLTETLPTIFATVGSMALVSAYNWVTGRKIKDVAKDIVDGVLGEEKSDERKS
jgi:hypothetical protein